MLWFDGPIRTAVDRVKSSGLLLLVFVQGEDNLSKKYEIYLNEEGKFNADDYVAIKIPHDSVALQQFKQIYVSVPIPSVFLIQKSGVPLKVISSPEVSDIHDAINDAISKQKIRQEKRNKVQCNKELSQSNNESNTVVVSKPLQHVRNIGRRISDITEEEIQKRLKEIRAFPRFWLIESNDSNPVPKPPPSPRASARIQFRLPNSTMPSWEFPDLSTLGDVRAYLMETMKLKSNFRLLRTYPRCAFGPEDEFKTLADLSLTPSATLIVVPVEDKTVQAKVKNLIVHQSFLSSILNTVFWPWFTFLKYIRKHVFRMRPSDNGEPRRPPSANEEPRRLPSDTSFEKTFNKKTSTSNIHGFKFDDDPDTDTEHPDNGNSTQQRFQK